MEPEVRFELTTFGLWYRRSYQLSYSGILGTQITRCFHFLLPLHHTAVPYRTGIRTQTFFLTIKIWRIRVAVCISNSLNRICTYLRVATHLVLLHKLSKNHPNGTRTRISSVKGWYPRPVRRWGVKAVFYGTATRRKEVFKIYRSRVTLEWFEHSLSGWEPDLLNR